MEVGANEHITTLLNWQNQVREEIANLKKRQAELAVELSKKDTQLRNINSLLESEGYTKTSELASEMEYSGSIADCAYSILRDLGQPIYYKDLSRKMLDNGISIPGKDPPANLLTHISRDDRFTRTARGVYALTEWRLPKKPMRPSKRKRRPRIKRKSSH